MDHYRSGKAIQPQFTPFRAQTCENSQRPIRSVSRDSGALTVGGSLGNEPANTVLYVLVPAGLNLKPVLIGGAFVLRLSVAVLH